MYIRISERIRESRCDQSNQDRYGPAETHVEPPTPTSLVLSRRSASRSRKVAIRAATSPTKSGWSTPRSNRSGVESVGAVEACRRVRKAVVMADERTFVIVGASLAGAKAAETLRDEGFTGRIVLVG